MNTAVSAHPALIERLSLDVCNTCQTRRISTINAKTPLLVPSFSSRGIPSVSTVHQSLSDHLVETPLVSAYDLHHGLLSAEDIFTTDILFLDSGGYEAYPSVDLAEPYLDARLGKPWTLENYHHVVELLEPPASLVLVSFDTEAALTEQTRLARSFFSRYSDYASDFLYKPPSDREFSIDVDELILHLDEIASFDILGITEKELGHSVVERCRNLLRIRQALYQNGHETPIHIFGCLDPSTILAYFLCGADVFDGLAWLRFAFADGVPIYHGSSIILNNQWSESDQDVVDANRAHNLHELRTQARAMRRYSLEYDMSELAMLPAWGQHLLALVRAAGLEM